LSDEWIDRAPWSATLVRATLPAADLFGVKGRAWLAQQELPEDERHAVARHLREHDCLTEDLCVVERDLARHALVWATRIPSG